MISNFKFTLPEKLQHLCDPSEKDCNGGVDEDGDFVVQRKDHSPDFCLSISMVWFGFHPEKKCC